jgi:hypothetical protein
MTTVSFSPIALLRSAGIPFSWLDEISCPEAARRLDASDDERARRVARAAWLEATRSLRSIATRPLFELAVACANPTVYTGTLRGYVEDPERRTRKRARALAALLQRFAAKNDTANGFGPVDRVLLGADVDLELPESRLLHRAERRGLVAWWAVQAIADSFAGELSDAGAVPWVPRSWLGLSEDVVQVGERAVPLGRERVEALRALRQGSEPRDGVDLAPLVGAGLVRQALHVPPSQPDPALWLAEWLRERDGERCERWSDAILDVRAHAQQISEAPPEARAPLLATLERRLQELVGEPMGARSPGEFYADRLVFYEEARGASGDYVVGGRLLQRLRDELEPFVRLAAARGYARHLRAREWLYEAVGGAEVRLPQLAVLLEEREAELVRAEATGGAELEARLARAFRLGGGRLEPAAAAELASELPQPELSFFSPDVMFEGESGSSEPVFVVGDHHAGIQVLGLLQLFFREGDVYEWLERALPRPLSSFAQIVSPRSQGKVYLPELPAWSIEFEAAALSPLRTAFGDVRIVWEERRPLLELPGGNRLELLPHDVLNPLYRILSPHAAEFPEIEFDGFTPDLRIGDVIVQRARWRLDAPQDGPRTPEERFVAARRWRRHHGLPERVFVRADNQRKPFYVDFRSPLLADLFWHWLDGARELVVEPMRPGPDGLWLAREGHRFCSELRLSAVIRSA